ncbi:MAG: hypothetical protein OXU23_09530 [Candidatus Poribacteria bacterium]|nr:hypothetical protein [Candidatus Poribacteria bacterium]
MTLLKICGSFIVYVAVSPQSPIKGSHAKTLLFCNISAKIYILPPERLRCFALQKIQDASVISTVHPKDPLCGESACIYYQQPSTKRRCITDKIGGLIAENTPNANRVPQSILDIPTDTDTGFSKKSFRESPLSPFESPPLW